MITNDNRYLNSEVSDSSVSRSEAIIEDNDGKKIIPVIKAVHEIKKDDFSMKVMDHNYYIQERWEDYLDINDSFFKMIYRRISNILH